LSQPTRILLIEDVETDAILFARELERSGMRAVCHRVESIAELETALEDERWDCVVSDYSLAGFDARDVMQVVRAYDAEVPFLVLSGSIGEEATAGILKAGAQDCMFKDRPGRWVQAIRREIDAARSRVESARTAEVLREMEGYHHATFDSGPLAILHLSPDWRILRANHRFQVLVGYDIRELEGMDLLQITHPEDVPATMDAMRAVLEDAIDPHVYRKRYLRKDGSAVHVEVSSTLIRDQLRRPQYVLAFVNDITDRLAAEAALRESEARYRTIVELAKDLIISIDTEGRFRMVNQAAEHAAGWTREELKRMTFLEFVHPEDHDHAAETFARVLGSGESQTTNLRTRKADGGWLHLEVVVSSDVREGDVAGVVVVARDLGERIRAEEERERMKRRLELADRLGSLGRVSAGIAHEFNNVLMSIAPFAEVLAHSLDPGIISEASSHITAAIARGRRITHEILRYTSPSLPIASEFDAGEWADTLRAALSPLMTPLVQLRVKVPAQPLVVRADRSQMEQVVHNLVTNARDAIEGRGAVVVSFDLEQAEGVARLGGSSTEPMVHLVVSDDGPGIPGENMPRLFEPFFTTKRAGTGLGLPIAFDLVRRNGGSLVVDSEEGKGTAIHILLPGRAGSVRPARPAEPAEEERGGAGLPLSVLIVEDDEAVGDGLVSLLSARGIETRWVLRGGDAVPAIEEFDPQLVLLDVGLPDMHGADVWALVRERWRDLPVIFSTGHGDEVSGDPATTTLRKPYGVADLVRAWEVVRPRR
jgi:two-component system, cell cycle sensor histidine kinase and response regulator CckA